ETSLARCDRVVFVPFRLIDFSNVDLLRRFRGALVDAALTPPVHDALLNFDTLELVPERRVVFPDLGGTITDVVANSPVLTRRALLGRPNTGGTATEPGPAVGDGPDIDPPPDPPPPRPPRPPLPDEVADSLWENAASKLSAFFGTATVRRGSQSLFVPSDVRVEEGAVQSPVRAIKLVFVLRDGTRIADLSASIALAEVDRIAVAGSDPAADVAATGVLALSRNGIVFPMELPTVTVSKGATETKLITVRAAGADVNLVQHLADNRLHYSQAVFRNLDAAMIAGLLSPFSITLNGEQFPLVQVAEPVPLRIVGNALAFKINTDPVNDAEWREFMASRGLTIGQAKIDIVPLSSGGIFAEAVLGRFNCAERLDLSRFFNWQDSPIPIQPTDIAAIQTGTRAQAENLTPGQFSSPLVSITPSAPLPDPTGLAGALAAIQNGNMFRDMSGLADTIKLATETAKLSAAGATAVGTQASENLKTSVNADTERRKIAADLEKAKVQAATELEKAKLGKSIQDKNITEQGAIVNKEDELKKKQQEAAKNAGKNGAAGGSAGGTGSGTGTGSAGSSAGGASSVAPAKPASIDNSALARIIGNDETLRPFIGMSADSPEPTPAVTSEGVPLQVWDFYGPTQLLAKETDADEAQIASIAVIEEIISHDLFKADVDTIPSLLLGDRRLFSNGFDGLLMSLSLAPAGSVKTLNIIGHCASFLQLDFAMSFIYTRGSNFIETSVPDDLGRPFLNIDLSDLIRLLATPEINVDGVPVRLSDVRKAFPADGEVHVFNMSNPLREDFLQVLANVFLVRTTGFTNRPVRVKATLIGETEGGTAILSKKIDVGFVGDPVTSQVDFFGQLLLQDRALTGLFTAFPRRA
ncbi:MAG: hypothetical protein KDI45_16850, partial [Candidatus Accumulibacter sp.]|nr:hypothetical protein [Accumulibacter sp.]